MQWFCIRKTSTVALELDSKDFGLDRLVCSGFGLDTLMCNGFGLESCVVN